MPTQAWDMAPNVFQGGLASSMPTQAWDMAPGVFAHACKHASLRLCLRRSPLVIGHWTLVILPTIDCWPCPVRIPLGNVSSLLIY